jgi:hypothetical protein
MLHPAIPAYLALFGTNKKSKIGVPCFPNNKDGEKSNKILKMPFTVPPFVNFYKI